MIINARLGLKEKYKAERAQLEANNNVQRCLQCLLNKVDNELGIDQFEQNIVDNDGSMLRNLSTVALPF